MDFQVRITEVALADFEDILNYSWANFPQSAERFGNAVLNHLNILKAYPRLGSPVPGRPGVRRLVHTPISIYYRIHYNPNFVEILHFWHTARFPPSLN